MKTILPLAIVAILIVAGLFFLSQNQKSNPTKEISDVIQVSPTEVVNTANFICADNKSIQTKFTKDSVDVVLSDARTMKLTQTVSASGARYANADESFIFWNKGDTAFVEEAGQMTFKECVVVVPEQSTSQIANPASVNCEKVGGKLEILKSGSGGEYGLCNFEDGKSCEEWALFRGQCPLGGVKTTGFDTIDQKYCAWVGGETTTVVPSECTLKDGTKCPTEALYNGTCPPIGQ